MMGRPWRCDLCGASIPDDIAFAPMETLELLCASCLGENLKPCEACGAPIRASGYQHLPSGRVVCEPCAVRHMTADRTH
jgi:formylmethanofuran dehydrogenase subunit E